MDEQQKPWQFKRGNPGPKGLKKAVEVPPEVAQEGSLAALRGVLSSSPEQDVTPMRQLYRAFMKEDPKGFLAEMRRLEEREEGSQAAVPEWDGKGPCPVCKRPPTEVDPGAERVKALINKLLEGK